MTSGVTDRRSRQPDTLTMDRSQSLVLAQPSRNAPVAQWIEQRFPKPRALVRFRPGASALALKQSNVVAAFVVRFALLVFVAASISGCGHAEATSEKVVLAETESVVVVDADGAGEPTVVPADAAVDPTWSDDGEKIAYNEFAQLSVVNADGTEWAQLFDNGNSYTTFAWAPDSERIAFVRVDPDAAVYVPAIFVMRADGSSKRKLVRGHQPSWSPDATRIAFGYGHSVFVIRADGTGKRRVGSVKGDQPFEDVYIPLSWSSDGHKIAYTTTGFKDPKSCQASDPRCSDPGYVDPNTTVVLCRLHIVDSNGGATATIVGGGLLGKHREQCETSWSPDGKQISFTRNGFVHTINRDGTGDRRLTRGLRPSWSPDGKHIVLRRGGSLYVIAADGSGARRLVRAEEFSWAPDGARIVVARVFRPRAQGVPGKYAIVVMKIDGTERRQIWPRRGRCDCGSAAWQTH